MHDLKGAHQCNIIFPSNLLFKVVSSSSPFDLGVSVTGIRTGRVALEDLHGENEISPSRKSFPTVEIDTNQDRDSNLVDEESAQFCSGVKKIKANSHFQSLLPVQTQSESNLFEEGDNFFPFDSEVDDDSASEIFSDDRSTVNANLEEIDFSECCIFDERMDRDLSRKIVSDEEMVSGEDTNRWKTPNFCAVNSKFRRIATLKRDISTKFIFQAKCNIFENGLEVAQQDQLRPAQPYKISSSCAIGHQEQKMKHMHTSSLKEIKISIIFQGDVDQQPCWVIMLEVLDNLSHDLIYSENQMSQWMEVWVEKQNDRVALSELYKPLHDPLITRCLEILELDKRHSTQRGGATSVARRIWSKVFPKPQRCWLPTGCLKLLEVLHGVLPKMSLIASDFSYLPDVTIPGERAPLVSTKKDGTSSDYSSYLEAKGDADIFFPTDFWLLERMDHYCSEMLKSQKDKSSKQGKKRRTITLDTSSFMEEFGLPSKTRTKDGYNPLLDDFKNTKFYLSVPTHNTK